MSNLHRRLNKLEERRNAKIFQLPPMLMKFIDVVHDDDGRPYPGPCVKMLRMQSGSEPQWYDADMNSVANHA